jgi:hypothetical protein
VNESSSEMFATVERLLTKGHISAREALTAVYVLGKFDGKIEMAKAGEEALKALAAAKAAV